MTFAAAAATNRSMTTLLLTLNALICVALIILILLQRSDPASGGMFGGAGGGSQPVVRNPLAKPTAVLAALFLLFSLALAYLNKGAGTGGSVMSEGVATPAAAQTVSGTLALPQPSLLGGTASGTGLPVPAPVAPAPQQVSATGQ